MQRAARYLGLGLAGYAVTRYAEDSINFETLAESSGIIRPRRLAEAYWMSFNPPNVSPPLDTSELNSQCSKRASVVAAAALEKLSVAAEASRVSSILPLPLPFNVEKRPSGIPGAGDGAFLTGKATRGEVVSFYCGEVHAPITGRVRLLFQAFGSRISGHEAGLSYTFCLPSDFLILGDPSGKSSSTMGPLLNHPSDGAEPNCVFYRATLDRDQLSSGAEEELSSIAWASKPRVGARKRQQEVLLVIALRDLSDEELFVDYAYSEPYPEWFVPCSYPALPGTPPSTV